ncbi:MAG TPA: OmpA family protein [Acidobacteriota bacterium]|nr:OmpA family protein [Acidobacteriota bacterium]
MIRNRSIRITSITTLLFVFVALAGTIVSAQTKLEGVIKGRNGAQIILQTADSPKVIVLLTDSTDVGQFEGALKARTKRMSMAALIPGLPIKVEGTYNAENQLVATKIRFKGNDLEQAQAIQAGLAETQRQAQKNKAELEKQNAELAAQNAALKEQSEKVAAQNAALKEQSEKVAANKAAIDAAVARFGQLDDYYILDEVTVYFGNGKVKVDPKYIPQLVTLAEKSKSIKAYMIQVKGYASSSGSASLNQKLSQDRANNVTNILLQKGHVPLTNMLAPGAMGESRQVVKDKKADSEAENRRVVVRILQNKGIAGL